MIVSSLQATLVNQNRIDSSKKAIYQERIARLIDAYLKENSSIVPTVLVNQIATYYGYPYDYLEQFNAYSADYTVSTAACSCFLSGLY